MVGHALPVIYYSTYAADFSVQFDDDDDTTVALVPGTGAKALRYYASDTDIDDAGLRAGHFTACIKQGESMVGIVSSFVWNGIAEVSPTTSGGTEDDDDGDFAIGIPVTEIWNVFDAQVPITYATMANPSVTAIPPDKDGIFWLQVGSHVQIESERLDAVEIATHINNGKIQIFRRMIPTAT